MFPLAIYWVHSSCAQILKIINRMGQSDRIKRLTVQLKHWRPLHTVLCTACPPPVGWEDSDYFSGLSDLHVLSLSLFFHCDCTHSWPRSSGRRFFIRSLQMVHSSTRGSVCFLSSVCEGCSSGRETVCVCGGGSGRSHNAQTTMTAVKQWRRPAYSQIVRCECWKFSR